MSSNTLDGGSEPFGAGWTSYSVGLLLGLLLIGLVAWSVVKSLAESEELQPSAPNVLLLVADDLGYNDVGSFGDGNALTPNIDALAAEGVSFTRHYADTTCSPSRVALLTGMFPQRMGFRHNGIIIPEEYPTIAELLKAGGYDTDAVGKWHAGSHYKEGWPLQKGFDSWFGFLTQFQLADVVPHDHDVRMKPTYINPVLRIDNDVPQRYTGHLSNLLLERSLDVLESKATADQPWFLYHAFFAPHTPIQPDREFSKLFEDSPQGRYRALVSQLDDAVGQLIESLKDSGQYQNTIIVFMSDNGGTNKQIDNNKPYFGAKAEYYEGSFRTPLIVSWPDRISGGRSIGSISMNVDLMPTLLELLAVPAKDKHDGYSYAKHLLGIDSSPAPSRSRLWEEYVWRMDANSYSYLDAERNQRYSGLWGISNHWADLNVDESGATSLSEESGEIYRSTALGLWRDHNEMATIVNESLRDVEGAWQFSNFDWTRTPGLNAFSLGLGIGPILDVDQAALQYPLLIAEQTSVWKLILAERNELIWEIAGQSMAAEDLDLTKCNQIVLSSHTTHEMRTKNDSEKPYIRRNGTLAKLFVNNRLQSHALFAEPKLTVDQIRQPTVVFDNQSLARESVYIRNTSTSSSDEPFTVFVNHKLIQKDLAESQREGTLFYPDIRMTQPETCQ